MLFVNGRFSESYEGIVGAPKIKRFVSDINQLKLKRWQYEKLLEEDGLLTLFEEDKEPFFSPKPPKEWIEYDGLLLSRKVS